jgi:hypothetical protein
MNLAWLVAVLQPHDVAPHPNFPDDEYDAQPAPRLAAFVIGDAWRRRRASQLSADGNANGEGDVVTLAQRCLRADTIAVSVAALAARLTGARPTDVAEAAALALLTCSAAAELDDYTTCFAVLDAQLRWTPRANAPDDALVRAALLQQKALRLRDAGQPHLASSLEAADMLMHLNVAACSAFPTSRSVSWSSLTTLEQVRVSLLAAIGSLISMDDAEAAETRGMPTWQEQVRSPAASVILRTTRDRADTYASYVAQLFARQFGSQTRTIGGPERPDLFSSVLLLELAGHGQVYAAREELALLRLVQAEGDPSETADALRLLRHAAAKNELDLALRRLRSAGPLSVLSHDARQVLRTRTAPELLRTVELRVLTVAAELLAPAEARAGLAAVRTSLAAGGPPDLPGEWQLPMLRKEVAWVAAAVLGNACGAVNEVAGLLLDEVAKEQADEQLLDWSLQRAAAELEWSGVSRPAQRAWIDFLEARAAALPGTAEAVLTRIGRPPPASVSASPLDKLIHQLNVALTGGPVDPALVRDGVPLIRDALATIRADAARGSYSIGGTSKADVAAGLALVAHADELWPDLTEFLVDPAVHREDRSRAFERLARSRATLPSDVADRFRRNAQQLLMSNGPDLFDTSLVPYPEALRFLGSHSLLSDADTYDAVAALAGGATPAARREAAITVAALAAARPRSELLALALPLARDDDVEVRAHAGRALAVLARPEESLAAVAQRRLGDLLAEDGLLAPLLVLRALADVPGGLAEAVRRQVEDLAQQHPSRSVREEATRLAQQDPPSEPDRVRR